MARTTPHTPTQPHAPHSVHQLATQLANPYALTPADVTALGQAIGTARVTAYQAAYADAISQLVGTLVTPDQFEFPGSISDTQRAAGHSAAHGIARTYSQDLSARTHSLAQQYSDQHAGDLSNAAPVLNDVVQTWAYNHASWKAAQISNAETGQAADAATRQAIDQTLDGDLSLPDGTSQDDYVVAVQPADSSSDLCSQYAGNTYSLDQYDELPPFPIHPNCIHELVVSYTGAGVASIGQLPGQSAADALAAPEPGSPAADRIYSRFGPWAWTLTQHEQLERWRQQRARDEQADAATQLADTQAAAQQEQLAEQTQVDDDEADAEYQSALAEGQPANPDAEQQGINPLISQVGEDDAADAAQDLDDDDFPDMAPDLTPDATPTTPPDTSSPPPPPPPPAPPPTPKPKPKRRR